ncbi:hypothetical protein A6R68_05560, partial [Neotoma lepida]
MKFVKAVKNKIYSKRYKITFHPIVVACCLLVHWLLNQFGKDKIYEGQMEVTGVEHNMESL